MRAALSTFPRGVSGRASTNSIVLGFLNAARCSRHRAMSSSAPTSTPIRRTSDAEAGATVGRQPAPSVVLVREVEKLARLAVPVALHQIAREECEHLCQERWGHRRAAVHDGT